jgi:hypothetical protein
MDPDPGGPRTSVPEFIHPVFAKTSPKRSFSMTESERFGLVSGAINSDTGSGSSYNTAYEHVNLKYLFFWHLFILIYLTEIVTKLTGPDLH